MIRHFQYSKIIALLLTIFLMALIFLPANKVYAEINASSTFTVTFNGKTTSYHPGTQVKLSTAAVSDGQTIDSFEYDTSVIPYPGFFYSTGTGQYIMTFKMPYCDVTINSIYNDGWAITRDDTTETTTELQQTSAQGYSYVDYSLLSVNASGRNIIASPGDVTITTYDSSSLIHATIDGTTQVYAAGQPIVINQPWIVNKNIPELVDGYEINGEFVEGDRTIYTDYASGELYIQTILPGQDSDVIITKHASEGCKVTLKDNAGSSFDTMYVNQGDVVTLAVPTTQGEYKVGSSVTATDDANNQIDVNIISQTDKYTVFKVTATSTATNVVFTWRSIAKEDTPTETAKTEHATPAKKQLDSKINSTGVIKTYSAENITTPQAVIDADDIQKNRDEIIKLQKELALSDDSDSDEDTGIYFFHDPQITDENGHVTTLEGWYMQRGSSVPKANDTWLQIG